MAIHRIYASQLDPPQTRPGCSIEITGDEAHHAASVKRLTALEQVELLNGRGLRASGIIRSIARRSLVVEVLVAQEAPRPAPEVIVAAPPPKGPRAEAMIEQLSQVGVSRWIPLTTQRSVVEPRNKRVARWRSATVVESAKQCGRAWFMEIDDPAALPVCLHRGDQPLVVFADAGGGACSATLAGRDTSRPILLLIGPEGGFSEDELEGIKSAGGAAVCLGPNILRLETAAVVGAAAILAELAAVS